MLYIQSLTVSCWKYSYAVNRVTNYYFYKPHQETRLFLIFFLMGGYFTSVCKDIK